LSRGFLSSVSVLTNQSGAWIITLVDHLRRGEVVDDVPEVTKQAAAEAA
jgi:hypothetical protein